MKFDSNPNKRLELYSNHLQEVSGVKFTSREIDVIACILHNRGEKKIGALLSISYRTVSSHVRNIMNKFSCNSRDCIIDVVEKSGKLQHLRQYYFYLVLQGNFIQQLQKIAAIINRSGAVCSTNFTKLNEAKKNLLQQIKQHLKLANVTLIDKQEKQEGILQNLYVMEQNNNIALLLDSKTDQTMFGLSLIHI